ncbi:hypothetical protein BGX34_011011 [Mortierella sp. NVP85]|nr:hypothetical protein BGX34_011011 [Mortierella sp. NVP85]
MVFGSIISSSRGSLSLQQNLDLANLYLETACKSTDPDVVIVLCHDTEVSLFQAKRAAKNTEDKTMRSLIADVYTNLGTLMDTYGYSDEAKAFYKKSKKLGGRVQSLSNHPSRSTNDATHSIKDISDSLGLHEHGSNVITIPRNIFPSNVRPPIIDFKPPEPDARLNDTAQLAYCLGLLLADCEPDDILDAVTRTWLQVTKNEPDEKERLMTLATDVIRAFRRDEFKDAKAVAEVVYLAPVLENSDFRYLVKEFYSGIDQSGLLDVHQLEGIAQLVQGARSGHLDADDLVKMLELLSTRLKDTHQQSTNHLYRLTQAVSHVLDAMADTDVKGLDRERIHEPLLSYLDGLKRNPDSYLVYQAAYAYQALQCVPDDETLWQAAWRRTGKVIKGVSGLVTAVRGLDIDRFIEGLMSIQQGLDGASKVIGSVKTAHDRATSLVESGRGFFECLKEGFSFSRKCAWYSALRGADSLIGEGLFADFKKLVYEAPCRRDAAFQWGVCERLGEIAANRKWDSRIRESAITFLGEIYRNDVVWDHHTMVKQWILDILMQLSSKPGGEMKFAEKLLLELQSDGDDKKQALYRAYCENGVRSYPLKPFMPAIGSPSLLDRVL